MAEGSTFSSTCKFRYLPRPLSHSAVLEFELRALGCERAQQSGWGSCEQQRLGHGPSVLGQGERTCEVGPHFFRHFSSGDCNPPAQTAGVLVHSLSQEDAVGLEAAAGGGRTGEAVMEKEHPLPRCPPSSQNSSTGASTAQVPSLIPELLHGSIHCPELLHRRLPLPRPQFPHSVNMLILHGLVLRCEKLMTTSGNKLSRKMKGSGQMISRGPVDYPHRDRL
ncbi:photoreceptor disk component PRCD isoform X2 [Onychomys torridus]|uniref:photoreceptor disk component PRCD isoform X2 n=1 Tax=Onychomys torridus TaxID=38674 RepID=UPI00167FD310|nr:photoreceptor disk component PRCD isoform X2 [Onychomys torridus]